jgi:hypothetical protein
MADATTQSTNSTTTNTTDTSGGIDPNLLIGLSTYSSFKVN